MEYYKLLNLTREPFSNTPDPGLFFRSTGHAKCLQELEIAIRLGRGLAVVAGEVGTGKTTLCRHLIRSVADDPSLEIYLVLDPSFESGPEMLAALNAMFNGQGAAAGCATAAAHKEMIKDFLFAQGVQAHKRLILVVDEGQKLSSAGVEILRELLNYETNDQKLLQILIFGQNEIDQILARHPNFADRVSLFHRLLPLSPKETALFIRYRLERSRDNDPQKPMVRFSRGALGLIHSLTGGYPRKIINLCHSILLTLIIAGTTKVTPAIVRKAAGHLPALNPVPGRRGLSWALAAAVLMGLGLWLFFPAWHPLVSRWSPTPPTTAQKTESLPVFTGDIDPPALPVQANATVPAPVAPAAAPEIPARQTPSGDLHPLAPAAAEPMAAVAVASLPLRPGPEEAEASAAAPMDLQPPLSLGKIRVEDDETLWNMVETIYGKCTPRLVARIVRHNAGMTDADHILQGQQIDFPALEGRRIPSTHRYWIELARFTQLKAAYAAVRHQPETPLRILMVRQPDHALDYLVVLRRPADDPLEARDRLARLPATVAAEAAVTDLDGRMVIGDL
ncbi:MAG: AAA family ATPase [Desulfobacteraceae bacterium]|nr:AAA family ATPase [Desulfobacteraceae bacterium]